MGIAWKEMEDWVLKWSECDLEQCWMDLWLLWRSGEIKEQLASRLEHELPTPEGELEAGIWDGWREVWGGDTFNHGNSRRNR